MAARTASGSLFSGWAVLFLVCSLGVVCDLLFCFSGMWTPPVIGTLFRFWGSRPFFYWEPTAFQVSSFLCLSRFRPHRSPALLPRSAIRSSVLLDPPCFSVLFRLKILRFDLIFGDGMLCGDVVPGRFAVDFYQLEWCVCGSSWWFMFVWSFFASGCDCSRVCLLVHFVVLADWMIWYHERQI